MKKTMCILLSTAVLWAAMPFNVFADNTVKSRELKNGTDYVVIQKEEESDMSERQKAAVEKFNELYKDGKIPENIAESELYDIVNNLIYGELYQQGQLTDREREMISLAALTTLGTTTILRTHIYSALNAGLTPVEITETVYHCTPYVGTAKSLEAIAVVNDVFDEKGIKIPESTATVTEDSRFDDGSAAQTELFGNLGDTKPAEGEVRLGRSFLPDYCFGDFYTRKGLTLEEHELLTWVCIATLGGAESQLTGHTNGNKNVGKSKEYMLEVLTDIMPYIGYPRTLNALNIINTVYDAEQ
ncbi:MAG: carboxymuconolactone decarboxylase family protein [Clostridia bacterium]|nr:carboxymuconolactone decarboxylase family protein [Clostridia bacterium]